eukprot:scaffold125951_cov39-Tisochrysis_lutea.AAC.1
MDLQRTPMGERGGNGLLARRDGLPLDPQQPLSSGVRCECEREQRTTKRPPKYNRQQSTSTFKSKYLNRAYSFVCRKTANRLAPAHSPPPGPSKCTRARPPIPPKTKE